MVEIKKSTLIWVAIGVLLIVAVFLLIKSSSISASTAQSAASAARTAASSASSGMVGGC